MPERRARIRPTPATPLPTWIDSSGGIVHRGAALEAGYAVAALRTAVVQGGVRRIRRYWLATIEAPPPLVTAASASGLLACVSAARHRGWWIPDAASVDLRTHIAVKPHAESPADDVAVHWNRPLVPPARFDLIESVEDALQHIADCAPPEAAAVIWESAAKIEGLAADYLRNVRWTSPRARELAEQITGLADSGLESIFVRRIRRSGVPVRQQVMIAGHRVDVLIGERLVVQIDGFAFHSTAADRRRDLVHDAELAARGFTVLRFGYSQVIRDWPSVARAIDRAIGAGLHLA